MSSRRAFSSNPNDDGGKYQSDDENQEFDSDRRFSNFMLFSGTIALACAMMASSVMH
jgi:cytochrome oxidase Cu insertion factor (SCO1/SenC/PrrC family)